MLTRNTPDHPWRANLGPRPSGPPVVSRAFLYIANVPGKKSGRALTYYYLYLRLEPRVINQLHIIYPAVGLRIHEADDDFRLPDDLFCAADSNLAYLAPFSTPGRYAYASMTASPGFLLQSGFQGRWITPSARAPDPTSRCQARVCAPSRPLCGSGVTRLRLSFMT